MPRLMTLTVPSKLKKMTLVMSVSDLQKAAERIGGIGGANEKKQLEWALELADKDIANWGAGHWQELQKELAMFRGGYRLPSHLQQTATLPLTPPIFPTEEQARQIREHFIALLASYAGNNNEMHISYPGPTDPHPKPINFSLRAGQFSVGIPDAVTDCGVRLMKLAGQFSSHLRQCPACGRWFVGKKTDAIFCGKTCASRKRTARKRQNDLRKRQRKAGK